ncbi:AraC family transcriptional regulator [Spirosoma areae]
MKALLEKLAPSDDSSFKLYQFSYRYYPTPWHYHPDIELVLVTKSSGKRIIGNHITDFTNGDLALIGPSLPHIYRNDEVYYEPDSTLVAESIVIHFLPHFLGEPFWQSPEMAPVRALVQRAAVGLSITGATRDTVAQQLVGLFEQHGMQRLVGFLTIMTLLAERSIALSNDLMPLSTQPIEGNNPEEDEKLTRIMTFISKHAKRQITLDELASEVSMSVPSVCRFFKKRTRKTPIEFINELKISRACSLLMQSGKTISEIAYDSGFNNLSNFNRQFRSVKGVNPQEFRRQFVS